jgi:hypothetical protein
VSSAHLLDTQAHLRFFAVSLCQRTKSFVRSAEGFLCAKSNVRTTSDTRVESCSTLEKTRVLPSLKTPLLLLGDPRVVPHSVDIYLQQHKWLPPDTFAPQVTPL